MMDGGLWDGGRCMVHGVCCIVFWVEGGRCMVNCGMVNGGM